MDSSSDEAVGAAAETKKKPPAAKGKTAGKGKAAGPKASSSAKESSLLKQSELSLPDSLFQSRISVIWVGLSDILDHLVVSVAESPAEFFAENKNIAGFDNVSCSPPIFLRYGVQLLDPMRL